MAIFGKLAYDAGVSTLTLLFVRFTFAAIVFGAAIAVLPALRTAARTAGRRTVRVGFLLGAIGYAAQAALFFWALETLDASLLSLLLYTYPAWVTLASFAIGRERPTARRLVALGLSSAGLVIVLASASSGEFDTLGAVLGVASALVYTAYILVADASDVADEPIVLSGLVCLGGAVTFAIAGFASGAAEFDFDAEGWLWLSLIALVSTCLAIAAFFAGLARVGPSTAAILSTFEPVVTVTLAYLAFSETLTVVQLGGAVLVLAAAVMLATPERPPPEPPVPPA
jgi:drug/metabolite transporter (DMT)-like permease